MIGKISGFILITSGFIASICWIYFSIRMAKRLYRDKDYSYFILTPHLFGAFTTIILVLFEITTYLFY
jgi:hypothetical protein